MKDLIKQILMEQQSEVVDMRDVEQSDFNQWKKDGLHPFVVNDNGTTIEFKEITLADLPSKFKRSSQRIYVLTERQAAVAQKFAKPIMEKINLQRQSIETLKQLFAGVLYQKFMKNDFGTLEDNLDKI